MLAAEMSPPNRDGTFNMAPLTSADSVIAVIRHEIRRRILKDPYLLSIGQSKVTTTPHHTIET